MLDFDVIQLHPSRKPETYGRKAVVLLISCIDFRLRDEVETLMEKIGLLDHYDEVVLPGASVALAGEKYPHWVTAAAEAIKIAKDMHGFKQIIILDHKDCGAFKAAYGNDKMSDPGLEESAHKDQMKKAMALIHHKFPDLKVYVYIMGIDGKVENWTRKI